MKILLCLLLSAISYPLFAATNAISTLPVVTSTTENDRLPVSVWTGSNYVSRQIAVSNLLANAASASSVQAGGIVLDSTGLHVNGDESAFDDSGNMHAGVVTATTAFVGNGQSITNLVAGALVGMWTNASAGTATIGTTFPRTLDGESAGLVTDRGMRIGSGYSYVGEGLTISNAIRTVGTPVAGGAMAITINNLASPSVTLQSNVTVYGKLNVGYTNAYAVNVLGDIIATAHILCNSIDAPSYRIGGWTDTTNSPMLRRLGSTAGIQLVSQLGTVEPACSFSLGGAIYAGANSVFTNTLTASNVFANAFSVILTNSTGSTSVYGQVVEIATNSDTAIMTCHPGDIVPIGVVTIGGVSTNQLAAVTGYGIAYVLANSTATSVTRGAWVSVSGTESGRADFDQTPNAGNHDLELGHCLETRSFTAGTNNLIKCFLHVGR